LILGRLILITSSVWIDKKFNLCLLIYHPKTYSSISYVKSGQFWMFFLFWENMNAWLIFFFHFLSWNSNLKNTLLHLTNSFLDNIVECTQPKVRRHRKLLGGGGTLCRLRPVSIGDASLFCLAGLQNATHGQKHFVTSFRLFVVWFATREWVFIQALPCLECDAYCCNGF